MKKVFIFASIASLFGCSSDKKENPNYENCSISEATVVLETSSPLEQNPNKIARTYVLAVKGFDKSPECIEYIKWACEGLKWDDGGAIRVFISDDSEKAPKSLQSGWTKDTAAATVLLQNIMVCQIERLCFQSLHSVALSI